MMYLQNLEKIKGATGPNSNKNKKIKRFLELCRKITEMGFN